RTVGQLDTVYASEERQKRIFQRLAARWFRCRRNRGGLGRLMELRAISAIHTVTGFSSKPTLLYPSKREYVGWRLRTYVNFFESLFPFFICYLIRDYIPERVSPHLVHAEIWRAMECLKTFSLISHP
ncbi:MAG: hypothetical protein QXV37_00985, partial [Candidatus Jordarchaeaceae archaeon]